MASFDQAYAVYAKNEGGWVNNPSDRGGETYKGVASRTWKNPEIWNYVRQARESLGPQPVFNAKDYKSYANKMNNILGGIKPLQENIKNFYQRNFWDNYKLGGIKNQGIASRLYDMICNGGNGALSVAKRAIGYTGKWGSQSIDLINSSDPKILFDRLCTGMLEHYDNIIAKNPTQSKFAHSWKERISSSAKEFYSGASNVASTVSEGTRDVANNVMEGVRGSAKDVSTSIDTAAYKYRHLKYNLGSKEPGTIDCSAFVSAVYRDLGEKDVGNSVYLMDKANKQGRLVRSLESAQPGDLIFINSKGKDCVMGGKYPRKASEPTHVVMMAGMKDGKIVIWESVSGQGVSKNYLSPKFQSSPYFLGVGKAPKTVADKILESAKNIAGKVSDTATNIAGKVSDTATNIAGKVSDTATNIARETVDYWRNKGQQLDLLGHIQMSVTTILRGY